LQHDTYADRSVRLRGSLPAARRIAVVRRGMLDGEVREGAGAGPDGADAPAAEHGDARVATLVEA
jgi:hypothetical protein